MMTIAMLQRNLYVTVPTVTALPQEYSAAEDTQGGMALIDRLRLCSYQDEAQKIIQAAADKVANGDAQA
jgi:hypothetical protein